MRQRPVSILCLLALFCLLAACSPKQDKKQEFMDHWKQLSQDSQGYSPAPSDLRPEPRVIMRHTEKQEQAASRPLPTIPVTLKLHNVDVGVALRSLAAAAGGNAARTRGVSAEAPGDAHGDAGRLSFCMGSSLRSSLTLYRRL